jgi:hypothetical protein
MTGFRVMRMATFKKKFGLTQKDINYLEREGFVEIQQGGFKGHSMCHSKIVVIRKEFSNDEVKRIRIKIEEEVKIKEENRKAELEQRVRRLETEFAWLSRLLPQFVDVLCKKSRRRMGYSD